MIIVIVGTSLATVIAPIQKQVEIVDLFVETVNRLTDEVFILRNTITAYHNELILDIVPECPPTIINKGEKLGGFDVPNEVYNPNAPIRGTPYSI